MKAREPARTRKLLVAIGVVTAVAGLSADRAMASHAYTQISIPVETVIEAPEGSTTELAAQPVPEGFADHMCEVRAHAENQESTHPDNDLVVESGSSSVLLRNVEAEPGQVVEADQMLELGDVITVSLIMGPDEVFSAGIEVIVECFAEETTTTQQVAPTQVATSTTEVPDTAVSSSVQTSTTIADEVLGTEVLPFTGAGASGIGLLALALLATGVLMISGTKRADD
jgi:hypothetical protein